MLSGVALPRAEELVALVEPDMAAFAISGKRDSNWQLLMRSPCCRLRSPLHQQRNYPDESVLKGLICFLEDRKQSFETRL